MPFTLLRPGRLTDGPYTSYDLNTLLKATSGTKRAVQARAGGLRVGVGRGGAPGWVWMGGLATQSGQSRE